MSKELEHKQIEEMARNLCESCDNGICRGRGTPCDLQCACGCLAEEFYEKGYRKQSENTVEVVRCKECWNCEKVPSILGTVLYCNEWCKDVDEDTFCSFGAKMKGGE